LLGRVQRVGECIAGVIQFKLHKKSIKVNRNLVSRGIFASDSVKQLEIEDDTIAGELRTTNSVDITHSHRRATMKVYRK